MGDNQVNILTWLKRQMGDNQVNILTLFKRQMRDNRTGQWIADVFCTYMVYVTCILTHFYVLKYNRYVYAEVICRI
jgi:hypothetical protein